MEQTNKYKIKNQAVLRKISEDYIIVPINGSLASEGLLFKINETASDIWKFFTKNKEVTVKQVIEYISKLYNIDESQITKDIENIIGIFLENKLLEKLD